MAMSPFTAAWGKALNPGIAPSSSYGSNMAFVASPSRFTSNRMLNKSASRVLATFRPSTGTQPPHHSAARTDSAIAEAPSLERSKVLYRNRRANVSAHTQTSSYRLESRAIPLTIVPFTRPSRL